MIKSLMHEDEMECAVLCYHDDEDFAADILLDGDLFGFCGGGRETHVISPTPDTDHNYAATVLKEWLQD